MDPVSIVGIANASLDLALKCASSVKRLSDLASKYKHAKLTVLSITQNLDTMQFTWDRIGAWVGLYDMGATVDEHGLFCRIARLLETGNLVMEALEEDLSSINVDHLTMSQRSKLIWNENTLHDHQNRIRDQAASMTLLLQTIQLPTPSERTKLMQKAAGHFQRSDESACSIIPSRLSVRTRHTDYSESNTSTESLAYRQLSFEDDLFSGMVYKRNLIRCMLGDHPKGKSHMRVSTIVSSGGTPDTLDPNGSQLRNSISDSKVRDDQRRDLMSSDKESVHVNRTLEKSDISFTKLVEKVPEKVFNLNQLRTYSDGTVLYSVNERGKEEQPSVKAEHMQMEAGVSVSEHNSNGYQPTQIAAGTLDQPEIIECFASNRGYISDSTRYGNGRAPLQLAYRTNPAGNVGALIDLHPLMTMNDCMYDNQCPMNSAIGAKSFEVLKTLLEQGMSPTHRHLRGSTSLHHLVSDIKPYHLEVTATERMLRLMLRHNANVNAQDDNGETPLHVLASFDPSKYSNNVYRLATLLLQNFATPDLPNKHGKTPLYRAARRHNVLLSKLLINFGAKLVWIPPEPLSYIRLEALDRESTDNSNTPVFQLRHSGLDHLNDGRRKIYSTLLLHMHDDFRASGIILQPSVLTEKKKLRERLRASTMTASSSESLQSLQRRLSKELHPPPQPLANYLARNGRMNWSAVQGPPFNLETNFGERGKRERRERRERGS